MEMFWLGFTGGCLLFLLLAVIEGKSYRYLLRCRSEDGVSVEIGDGYYFIVPESDYVSMKMYKSRAVLAAERGPGWRDFRDYGVKDWKDRPEFDLSPGTGIPMRRDER